LLANRDLKTPLGRGVLLNDYSNGLLDTRDVNFTASAERYLKRSGFIAVRRAKAIVASAAIRTSMIGRRARIANTERILGRADLGEERGRNHNEQ